MALSDITQKILDDAQAEAAAIIDGARTEAEAIAEASEEERAAAQSRIAEEGASQIESAERAQLSGARREAKRSLGDAKREALERVFASMNAGAANLSDADYTALLEKLTDGFDFAQSASSVQSARVPAGREDVSKAFLSTKDLSVEVIADAALTAGLVIEGSDANFDLTLTRRIADKRKALEPMIADKLF